MEPLTTRFDRLQLERAVDALYDTFVMYPLKDRIDVCPHCELDAAERRLHVRPLRALTWTDLGVYAFKALTSFGDLEDFKHFLPRLFELYVVDHRGAPYSLFMVCGKLEGAGWTTWPAQEAGAIRAFLDAWKRVLETRAGESEDDSWELDELRDAIAAL